eukprot:maker-scaffold_5-snap-gene-17.3-mRNA-1 protein AED:0.01 eAED:0.01 QI:61/1/1/1/1/1/2/123/261
MPSSIQIVLLLSLICLTSFSLSKEDDVSLSSSLTTNYFENIKRTIADSYLYAEASNFINNLEQTLLDAGPYGPIIIFAVYLITTIFMLPLWGFHITCGYVYGTWKSSLLIASTQAICAGAAFSVSRHIVGRYVKGFLQRKYGRKYTAIAKAVEKDGFRITLLLRLSPIIPFGMNNYVCGLTDMKLSDFVIGTFLGVLPGTTAYCNIGAMGKDIGDEMTPYQKGSLVLGIVAALAVIKVLSDLATKALKEAGIDDVEEKKID